ncbi:MAG: hypothetical protein A3G59_01045 [Candidatus Taylorbacteria bacterium RIFCSPLOWO2_12_FULL_47_20]|uniref:AAA+ ATPase domain-containing protein n=2 Tax=Candidatus Tayloriibacteriota TaxID=1817919 RepID=A0A1G2P8T2_9BACT|nr:MAG: hypothetical protein A3H68_00345 [Candidatus Taylorbacteria bacterium RIFCSPLOWO2_02_FULL_46_40]OHA44737.1 MAG: hypothetical protein A3G59_01045 [Candidatus Taylorbacteria bacterium RIFCSPLOWO2_12_FULL_47_20]
MLIFKRKIEDKIAERMFKGRAILIFGPRQAGKTTLSKKILQTHNHEKAYFNCDLAVVRNNFELGRPDLLKEMVGENRIAVFDEAQTIQNIGAILKAFIDTYPEVQIIATGSSSFDLANKIKEPLTGRSFEFILYPLSLSEITESSGKITREDIDELMRTGSYPAVVAERSREIKEDILKNLATNYLYKDIFTFESIRNPLIFESLIKMLAFQTGSLVSVNELAISLGVSRAIINKYLKLLEQAYVIKVIRPFSRNYRNELKKAFKIYFIDIGVRNAIIGNMTYVPERHDKGAIFESFFIMERFKEEATKSFPATIMFWRSRQGDEIDVVEEIEGKIRAYECKWTMNSRSLPKSFTKKYPEAETNFVSPDSIRTHLGF